MEENNTVNKTFLDYQGLQTYDTSIKNFIRSASAGLPSYVNGVLVFESEDTGPSCINGVLVFK